MRTTVLGMAAAAALILAGGAGRSYATEADAAAMHHDASAARLQVATSVVLGRKWAPLQMDGAICLPNFAQAHLRDWLGAADYARMTSRVRLHVGQIAQLRLLLANCSDRAQEAALAQVGLGHVFGLDLRRDGTAVLFTE